jgi:hypothetical protein
MQTKNRITLATAQILSQYIAKGFSFKMNQYLTEIQSRKKLLNIPSYLQGEPHRPSFVKGRILEQGKQPLQCETQGATH